MRQRDLSVYETNMNLLYDTLVDLGFTVVRPGGTFYIFPKALEEDANVFCQKAKEYDLDPGACLIILVCRGISVWLTALIRKRSRGAFRYCADL